MPKRKPAKKKPAPKKRPSVDKAKAEWHRIYGAAAQVPPEPGHGLRLGSAEREAVTLLVS